MFNKLRYMKPPLDLKDRKILEIMDEDGRAQVSTIARKAGMPRDTVHYRLQRMLKGGHIKFFHPVLDPTKLGYPVYTFVNFELHNFDEGRERAFYLHLSEHPQIGYVAQVAGKWDCTIAIAARSLEDFDSILRSIRKAFSDIVKDFDTASIIKEWKHDDLTGIVG